MSDRENRFEQIMRQTRVVFIQDCEAKIAEIQAANNQAKNCEITKELWVKTVYQHVHSMKGMALTLSYHQIDQSCQKIISLIQKPREQEWAAVEIDQLKEWLNELIMYIVSPVIGERE